MKRSGFFWGPVLLYFFSPSLISACAVCFGQGESDLSSGFFWGILILLLLPLILFGTIAFKIVSGTRKKERDHS